MKAQRISLALGVAGMCILAACSGGSTPNPPSNSAQSALHHARTVTDASQKPASGYSFFGQAMLVHPGYNSPTAAQATSTSTPPYGGVDFGAPAGMTLSQLVELATEYQFTVGSCGLGSPRFAVAVTNGTTSGNINFYIGPPPNYTGCPLNTWTNTGNLASAANLVDDSQLGGTFYDPYADAQARYGSYTITDISLVVDYYQPPYQTAQFDNVQINDQTYTFESADSCKDGGWQMFTGNPGPFKNQGQCVSYFNSNGNH